VISAVVNLPCVPSTDQLDLLAVHAWISSLAGGKPDFAAVRRSEKAAAKSE
jgi:hypothetical protein